MLASCLVVDVLASCLVVDVIASCLVVDVIASCLVVDVLASCLVVDVIASCLVVDVIARLLEHITIFAFDNTLSGNRLAARGVVVVSCNYRLGALGFLVSVSDGLFGNYGLHDQKLAMTVSSTAPLL